jgi:hypothetical protein
MRGSVRKVAQRNGLIEPYTVMLKGRPVVVEAASIEEAEKKAKAAIEAEEVSEQVTPENQTDGN